MASDRGPMPQVLRPALQNVQPERVPAAQPYNGDFDKQPPRPLVLAKQPERTPEKVEPVGCVFAKSCNLPEGVIDYQGNVTPELLKNYGDWAVMGTGTAILAGGTSLQFWGGSNGAAVIASRLGGTLSLGLVEGAAALAASAAVGSIALLLPNNSLSTDSAFYTKEQYHALSSGRTRVRLHVQQLTVDAVNVYGFYTGRKPDWENARVIAASPRGERFVADLGQGVELIWTPAADPDDLGIPALEGSLQLPNVWVYPPTEQADNTLVDPVHPPDYQDAIIWFPMTDIPAIYISLSVSGEHGYHLPPRGLTAFPDAQVAPRKTPIKGGGGLRKRWKTRDGTIFEWDSQHGTVEKYNKRGKHLGEFNPETGEQTKDADNTREVEP